MVQIIYQRPENASNYNGEITKRSNFPVWSARRNNGIFGEGMENFKSIRIEKKFEGKLHLQMINTCFSYITVLNSFLD